MAGDRAPSWQRFASTMQDAPIGMSTIIEHGARLHARSLVSTFDGERLQRTSFSNVAARARRLAAALSALGIREGDRVATLCWNHCEHLEAYLAIPGMGAVLHTLNFRLAAEQLAYVIEHAEDSIIILDAKLLDTYLTLDPRPRCVRELIVVGECPDMPPNAHRYEDLLDGNDEARFEWPELDERNACALCYTTGTTGAPRGIAYSHRSVFLHSLLCCATDTYAIGEHDRILLVVPMFHANAWGLPYAAWMTGADMVMPREFLGAERLAALFAAERPTFAAGVPTIWNDMLTYARAEKVDLSSLRMALSGGSALSYDLAEKFADELGVNLVQGWGLTETSPLAAIARPAKHGGGAVHDKGLVKTGRPVPGVELRIVDELGAELPWDGISTGEVEVRGPWVTGRYHRDAAPERFRDGWLRTGDVGHIDSLGYLQITDRSKDVIKSGGEWISSVELEHALLAHPDVREACVVGVSDPRWEERPLACIVVEENSAPSIDELRAHLCDHVARWWLPERWAIVPRLPRTSVGKLDKKAVRSAYDAGQLDVITVGRHEGPLRQRVDASSV